MISWLRNPRLFWNSFQFITGLRESRLVRLSKRPDAPYRAVAYGVPTDQWEIFEAAFPEYEIIFARPDITATELRLALAPRNMILLSYEDAPRRPIQLAMNRLDVVEFFASSAPIPFLERNGETAYGYAIDTMGDWRRARRPTEMLVFLENYDLTENQSLQSAAQHLLSAETSERTGDKCLIVPKIIENPLATEDEVNGQHEELYAAAADITPPENTVLFPAYQPNGWAAPDTIHTFISALEGCSSVVVEDSPLGLLAMLLGRKVFVLRRPFWAGFGPTNDIISIRRRRQRTAEEIVAILVFLLGRYVDESNSLIDPAENWALPGGQHNWDLLIEEKDDAPKQAEVEIEGENA